MKADDDSSSLEKLRERLYAPRAILSETDRSLREKDADAVPHAWERTKTMIAPAKRRRSFAVTFFFGALAFFVLAGAVAGYLLFSGNRSVSTDNVSISVQGPTAVSGGETLPLSLVVENKNPAAISDVTLAVDFPAGTRSAENALKSFTRWNNSLGAIAPGARVERSVQAVVFGSEHQTITLPITVQYKIAGSSAVFVKQSQYQFTVSTAPLSVTVDSLSQVVSGQSLALKLTVYSNATTPIANVAVSAAYPFGFAVASTSLASANGLFILGTLAPGDHRDILISGALAGQNNEQKVFRFTSGTLPSATSTTLGIAYGETQKTVTLAAPFLAVQLTLDESASEPAVIGVGTPITAKLTWTNTLPAPIQDGEIDVALSGAALDAEHVVAQSGFYRSSDTTVVFNRDTDPALRSIDPGASGSESFIFTTVPSSGLARLQNPVITFALSLSGRRVSEAQVPEAVSASLVRHARVRSDLALASDAVRTIGPFANTGPWPPVPGTPTTYTVRLSVTNTVNGVANGTVSFELPSYVTYTGAVSPADGSLTYNDVTRAMTWNLGDVASGVGSVNPPRQIAFQISFLPSTSQSGSAPALIPPQRIHGFDRFVQQSLSGLAPAVTTRTENDPAYALDKGKVR